MKILRVKDLTAMFGFCSLKIRRMEQEGRLPLRRKYTETISGWTEEEIEAWRKKNDYRVRKQKYFHQKGDL